MRSAITVLLLLFHISCRVELGLCNNEIIYIKPSPNIICPSMPCYTLMQYVTNQNSASNNVRLVLLSGTHELTNQYNMTNKNSVSITAHNLEMPSTIECNSLGRISFRSLELVRISSVLFTGCGGNKAISVLSFVLEDCSFMNGSNNNDGGPCMVHSFINHSDDHKLHICQQCSDGVFKRWRCTVHSGFRDI